ncbi:MAG: hypothetical protein WCF33_00985, partial [Pseudonocardiaceae bacterium]
MNVDRYGARWRRATIGPSPRRRPASSWGAHTHDPANRALPQQTMRQAWANNVPPAGGGGRHQGGITVMITVLVPKATRRVA